MMSLWPTLVTAVALTPAAVIPVGQAIEAATSGRAVLAAAARIEPPGPPFTAPHLEQDVHQLKRQQLASNALATLARVSVGSKANADRHKTLRDERMAPLVASAAVPSCCRPDGEDSTLDRQSARAIATSLTALATLCAADAAYCTKQVGAADERGSDEALQRLRAGACRLVCRAEALAEAMGLQDAVSSRWAARRLLGAAASEAATPNLDARTCRLPYDFVPALIALPATDSALNAPFLPSMAPIVRELEADVLRRAIPFEQQELLTADGRKVRERRHTSWLAEEGIGALAYSGKLMKPASLEACETVVALRDALHADLGERFDCALTNLYAQGGTAACAWHRDPEHGDAIDGCKWARPTYVVSCGETRRFAFRPSAQAAPAVIAAAAAGRSAVGEVPAAGEAMRHVVSLFSGDVIVMRDTCNDDFEHSVLAAQGQSNLGARVSIVFKRALPGRDGRRGHTLEGEGRRSRARSRADADVAAPNDRQKEQPPPRRAIAGKARGGANGRRGRGRGAGSRGRGGRPKR